MTVEELIEKLETMDKNAEVIMYDEVEDVYVPVEGVREDGDIDVLIY